MLKDITRADIDNLSMNDILANISKMVGSIVLHFKGDYYMVQDLVRHSETGEFLVAYKALYGECFTYVRPVKEFFTWVAERTDNVTANSVRFEPVTITSAKTNVIPTTEEPDTQKGE